MKIYAWETTRRCKFKCLHCRASATDSKYLKELSTEEGKRLIDSISETLPALLILTGGEPLLRDDIFELADYAGRKKIRVVMAPCGSSIDNKTIDDIKNAGIARISLSLDGKDSSVHDKFRGRNGAFDDVINAAKLSRDNGLEFQINTTITKLNVDHIAEINDIAASLGAAIHDVFLLVPTGRGTELKDIALDREKYDKTLNWIAEEVISGKRQIKVTCAPHYSRIYREKLRLSTKNTLTIHGRPPMGCLAGDSFVFISHTGDIQPCGFFDLQCGNIRNFGFNIRKAIDCSADLTRLKEKKHYKGKCNICEYWNVCKGCRARVFALKDDAMEDDPYCSHIPKISHKSKENETGIKNRY